jgi:hypothetical protein
MTTRTAATAIAMSQRTQSIPGQPLPPKVLQINHQNAADAAKMVSHMGVLARLPGATNLPTNPMMIPVMITPMSSTMSPFRSLPVLRPAIYNALDITPLAPR